MVRVLIPSGALGLGYDPVALERGIAARPDIIAIDGGSTDSGPAYLGRGVSKYSRASTLLEWRGLIEARARAGPGVPLIIGTAGTCGTDSAVDWLLDITREILRDLGQSARIAVLKSSQPPERVSAALAAGRIDALPAAPEIDAHVIAGCTNIVALAGVEQVAAALRTGADIIIAGRTTDTAIIAALPLMRGAHAGAAWHGAKIGECGALCATNPQSGVILLDVDDAGFTITPLADGARATPHTVSAHMLYENSDPYLLHEPGGSLDVSRARYSALDDRRVRVEGAQWRVAEQYTVKLEGARIGGYQTLLLALLRDRRYVENIEPWCADIIAKCRAKVQARMGLGAGDYDLELRIIGKNATLGDLETSDAIPAEVGVLALVTAPDQTTANQIGKMLNPYLLHHPLSLDEEQPTFAFPFSPAEVDRGAVYEFCLHHAMRLDHPMDAFTLETHEVSHAPAE